MAISDLRRLRGCLGSEGRRGNSGFLFFKQLVSMGARSSSMLPSVQQHPNLFLRLAFEDTREGGTASRTGVVLLNRGVSHCAGDDQRQRICGSTVDGCP
ncbi:hypothetical protein ACFQ3P_37885 [Paraburkholderia sabiae]|uniref:Uncharacterized protein n=1 Tax=Paraburkholderia sabiae TaxID=273251 RepID=A0ABU9QM80_9BURK|nr:hypothetical protein [Paraburkholderia sabiae]WJZ79959.1 hypothetical protein QEN71_43185 [Paraburkholderia sabiae]